MDLRRSLHDDVRMCIRNLIEAELVNNVNLPDFDAWSVGKPHEIEKSSRYTTRFLNIYNSRGYLMTLFDNSMILASYKFEQRAKKKFRVVKCSLSYWPNPGLGVSPTDGLDRLEDDEETEITIAAALINDDYAFSSNYIRLDYDLNSYREILHPSGHIHVGANNDLRLAIDRILSVSEFVDMILYLYYQKHWLDRLPHTSDGAVDLQQYIEQRRKLKMTWTMPTALSPLEVEHYLVRL